MALDDERGPEPAGELPRDRPAGSERVVALLEVLMCSGYPTQLALGSALLVFGVRPLTPDGGLSLTYVAAVSFADTAALLGLVLFLLRVHGEEPRAVLLGSPAWTREVKAGLWLIVPAFVIAGSVIGLILQFAPRLHTVPDNPLKGLVRGPWHTAIFALVVVIAGGIREEVQRAFLLHRFERWLGGPITGIVITSIVFGAGHATQGLDATIATAALGTFWGIVYFRRRSMVAPMVSHSGFNLLQLVQFVSTGR